MYADCYPFWVKVEHRESNGVLIVGHETPERYGVNIETYAITNYLGEVVTGRTIAIVARRVGTYNLDSQDSVVELYDCGTMLAPEEEREQIAKAQAEQNAKLKAEADAKAAETRKKIEIADAAKAKALKSNQDEAAKGDAYGLLRMGERYRDGDGVEKDLAKAKEYLQKAADAGSPTAAEELSKLKQ